MSVGGVGAAGGSAGAGAAVGGVGATGGTCGSSPGGTSGVEGVTSPEGKDASTKDISDAGDKAGTTYNINQTQNNVFINMSSQDSVELHNSIYGPTKAADCNNMDLQKLIEMMIAIKLLEAMSEGGSSTGGGFSTVA